MPAKAKYPKEKAARRNAVTLTGSFTIGASGAVSANSSECGTATQVASEDGRYLITLDRTYRSVRPFGAPGMVGPADAAFPTTTGSDPQYRNVTTSTFQVQFKRTDTQADTDPASGTICYWAAEVQEF